MGKINNGFKNSRRNFVVGLSLPVQVECVAAKQLGINFIGFEINKDYVELAKQRLNEVDA